jgi:hypothetical protein
MIGVEFCCFLDQHDEELRVSKSPGSTTDKDEKIGAGR